MFRKMSAAAFLLPAALVARAGEPEALIFDYESPKQAFENAEKAQYVPEHATQGKNAAKVVLDKPFDPNFGFWGGSNMGGKWGEYDQFVIDVFVENGPVKVYGWIRDKDGSDWWKRHNYEFKLEPGKRRLAFNLGSFTRQNGQGHLDLKTMDFFAIRFESEDPKRIATIYLDNARLVKGTGAFEVKVLFSFEGDDAGKAELEDWPEEFKGRSAMEAVAEHASHGRKALRLDSRAPAGNVQFSGFDRDWSKYDSLCFDAYNPSDKPVGVSGWVRAKDEKAGWWERYNYERVLKPGFNTVKLSIGGMTGPNGGKPIDTSDIVKFNIAVDRQTVFLDNIRLVKGVEEILVEGLKKFDFGPKASAVMPGFTAVTRESAYDKAKGWGWLPGGHFGRDFDMNEMLGRHRPPDDICRDFCQPTKATFAVDVPNGTYGVWLMLGPPGNGWGQWFRRRVVRAEGKTVVDQSFDLESFKAHEFMFQDSEDLPGDDLWEKYINVLFRPAVFDVEVTDGQLNIEFDSGGAMWSAMLNGLAVWPKSQETAAQKWLAGLDGQRKEQYQALHVEKLPEAPAPYAASEEEKARGYVRFVHSPDREIQVNSVPTPEEAKARTIDLFAAPGEYEDGCFGILPLKDCGVLKMSATDLSGPGGAAIPASDIRLMVVRYKALNRTAVYVPTPKYLDLVPAEGIAMKAGVARSFWVVVRVPPDAKPGTYRGRIGMEWPGGKADAVDLSLTVWPIQLVEPDFPMGMFMMGPIGAHIALDETGEAWWSKWKEVLEDARAHGLTSVDPSVSIPLKRVVGGKAEVDFAAMDRFMETAKAAGFRQELNGYSVGTGFRLKIGANVDWDAEGKRFGASSYAELVRAYFDAVREHAREKNWLPICFCTDDEYIVHPGSSPEKLAAHHRLLQENAPGFRFVAFDSFCLDRKNTDLSAIEKMAADIDTWGAGIHTPRDAEIVKKGGRRLWLYNTGMNRFTFGTYMFFARKKYDVKGFFQWVYSGGGTYGDFYLASHNESHYGVVYPSSRGLRPTPIWERIRAGCDDHRYLETAWKMIERAQASGKGAAEAKALSELIEKTFGRLKFGKPDASAVDGEGRAENLMDPAAMEAFRKAVAEGIVKLGQTSR